MRRRGRGERVIAGRGGGRTRSEEEESEVDGDVLVVNGVISFPFFFGMLVIMSDELLIDSGVISMISPLCLVPSFDVRIYYI
jgi:hypothetical protein